MSVLSKHSSKAAASLRGHEKNSVINFMGGTSYTLTPLNTLRIVAASSIFGEPQYYRDGLESPSNLSTISQYSIFCDLFGEDKNAVQVFEECIDNALDFDFRGTLDLALELRKDFLMRLNPSVIYIRACMHGGRQRFNEENPGYMKRIGKSIAERPDDLTNQFDYWMYKKGSKNGLPSLVKRTWSERLAEYSRYQLNKYKGKKLIDLVRISHASSEDISELVKTGKIRVKETEMTWESLRSSGKTWKEIFEQIRIPHMALLRNLRGIFSEVKDKEFADKICDQLKGGVLGGKQFPFRYWSAYKTIKSTSQADINHQQTILDCLEECIDISVSNMPKLKGKTICLSDNSGSAWGNFNSEYGTVTVAEIANLSSLITALQSDEGEVGVFGDNLSVSPTSKRNGLLSQLEETNKTGRMQGGGTENGIWVFFSDAIKNKTHYDNIFIYSDMQAGHGDLFGHDSTVGKSEFVHRNGRNHVDVLKMVQDYRKKVNPKVNMFTIQVAGYDNSVLPENLYRGAILAGWTGREAHFADAIIKTWNGIEEVKPVAKQ
jgi:hypothetical protein